jgi:hypothetical protein
MRHTAHSTQHTAHQMPWRIIDCCQKTLKLASVRSTSRWLDCIASCFIPHETFKDVVNVKCRVGHCHQSHCGPSQLFDLRLEESTLQRYDEPNHSCNSLDQRAHLEHTHRLETRSHRLDRIEVRSMGAHTHDDQQESDQRVMQQEWCQIRVRQEERRESREQDMADHKVIQTKEHVSGVIQPTNQPINQTRPARPNQNRHHGASMSHVSYGVEKHSRLLQ